jgi:hypothetical protein
VDKVEYWFNTTTGEVEVGKKSLSLDRIGPFETEAEARRALEIIAERARKLRAEEDNERWGS